MIVGRKNGRVRENRHGPSWVMDMIFRDDECRVRKDDFSEKLDS